MLDELFNLKDSIIHNNITDFNYFNVTENLIKKEGYNESMQFNLNLVPSDVFYIIILSSISHGYDFT